MKKRQQVAVPADVQAILDDLKIALAESLKLQSHYAKLLNQYDGGKRMTFGLAHNWIERLREVGRLPPKPPRGADRQSAAGEIGQLGGQL